MSLQSQVLHLYKQNYPNSTLQSISDTTGIQITRVFRILNGSDMKLSEYEKFSQILKTSKYNRELITISERCLEALSAERNNFILSQLKHALKLQEQKNEMNSSSIYTKNMGGLHAV